MSITEQGIQAEKKARLYLKSKGVHNLQQIDWIAKQGTTYFAVEVKHRELFEPPPFKGTGLDIRQIELRRQLWDDFKIDTLLVVFVDAKVYTAMIFSGLEKGKHFDTRNNIRIYPIENFTCEDFNEQ